MKIHMYHCALASFKDVSSKAKGNTRPKDLIQWPAKAGKANIEFTPLMNDLKKNEKTKRLIKLFENIDLMDTANSPIMIKRKWLSEQLGIDKEELEELLCKLYDMRLLHVLTLKYDFRKWLQHSKTKGCLVVMVCIEKNDYDKQLIVKKAVNAIERGYCDLFGLNEIDPSNIRIKKLFLIPNAHLSRDIGTNHKRNIQILQEMVKMLQKDGFDTELNSYGYPKDIQLSIIGHPQEYVLRSI